MKCPKTSKLQEFVDDELPENESLIISAHLDCCRKCRDTLETVGADASLVRERMTALNPAAIPALSAILAKGERSRTVRTPAYPRIWHASVRMPVPILIVIGIVFAGLVFGLLAQGRRPARLESMAPSHLPSETIVVSSASSFRASGLDLDLAKFQPIDHPNIIFMQEESR